MKDKRVINGYQPEIGDGFELCDDDRPTFSRYKQDAILAMLCGAVFVAGLLTGYFAKEPVAKPVHIVRVYQA
jgi:hypothetical protein